MMWNYRRTDGRTGYHTIPAFSSKRAGIKKNSYILQEELPTQDFIHENPGDSNFNFQLFGFK